MSIYKQLILDHYKNSPYRGVLKKYSRKVSSTNPSCGDEVTYYLLIKDGVIKDISFISTGCVISQASASIIAEMIKNQNLNQINKIKDTQLLKIFQLTKYSSRSKCALLPLITLKK